MSTGESNAYTHASSRKTKYLPTAVCHRLQATNNTSDANDFTFVAHLSLSLSLVPSHHHVYS